MADLKRIIEDSKELARKGTRFITPALASAAILMPSDSEAQEPVIPDFNIHTEDSTYHVSNLSRSNPVTIHTEAGEDYWVTFPTEPDFLEWLDEEGYKFDFGATDSRRGFHLHQPDGEFDYEETWAPHIEVDDPYITRRPQDDLVASQCCIYVRFDGDDRGRDRDRGRDYRPPKDDDDREKRNGGIEAGDVFAAGFGGWNIVDGSITPEQQPDPPISAQGPHLEGIVSGDRFYLHGAANFWSIEFEDQNNFNEFRSAFEDATLNSYLIEAGYFPIDLDKVKFGALGGIEGASISERANRGIFQTLVPVNSTTRFRADAALRIGDKEDHLLLLGGAGAQRTKSADGSSLADYLAHFGARGNIQGPVFGLTASADYHNLFGNDEVDIGGRSLRSEGGHVFAIDVKPQMYVTDNLGVYLQAGMRETENNFSIIEDGEIVGETTGSAEYSPILGAGISLRTD